MTRPVPDRPDFEVRAAPSQGATTLVASGEVDLASADDLGAAVREHLASGPVVLDLREVTFLDSSGVRMLDMLLRDVSREDWRLAIAPQLRPNVRQVLMITGMLDVLPWQDDSEEAGT